DFDSVFSLRQAEADEFYEVLQTDIADEDARLIQRQAFAGMIWSKQFYYFDIPKWQTGDPNMPSPPPERHNGRNKEWQHLNNEDIISMPDKWEYPWYAAWDLAFHCIALVDIDPVFAKNQLLLMTRIWYMHPNGQMPAYEWAFGDVNPPVHAWAVWEVYKAESDANNGSGDLDFLERQLHMLLLNFTWWVNRKDVDGHNMFQGGFLGLDNIGVFDRSAPLPTGGYINQADGTGWMAMYALNLMRIALELAQHNGTYEDIATKFFEHFLYIAQAMNNIGDQGVGLWDEEDQFYYDVLRNPDGGMVPLKIRSMVGLIPLYAVEILEPEVLDQLPGFKLRLEWFMKYRPELAALVSHWQEPNRGNRRLLSLLRGHRMKALLKRMLDETEFLSDYGIRSLSRNHKDAPYNFSCGDNLISVSYQPAESESGVFGGNSNWRGPIWFPVNYLLVTSLRRFAKFYGDEFKIECPAGSGNMLSLHDVADEVALRLTRLFRRDGSGRRPVFGDQTKFQEDPHFKDYILFHEYFHGDTGSGVGASHQTGWSGLVAKLLKPHKHD
ncbi:MAG: glucosidase, partial [Candidatus Nitrotoga sp.]